MIIFYTKTCDGCSGNHALMNMKSYCKKKNVEFEERRTILWHIYEEEADKIMSLHPKTEEDVGLQLPFFYGTESGEVLSGNSFTPTDQILNLIKAESPLQNLEEKL